MITWRVLYWEGDAPVWRAWPDYSWNALPSENVLWVDMWQNGYHTCLIGMDNFWLHGDAFGVFNDPENYDWYPGRQELAFRWTGVGSEEIEPVVPENAHVLRGVMLPDDVWEEVVREYSWRSSRGDG